MPIAPNWRVKKSVGEVRVGNRITRRLTSRASKYIGKVCLINTGHVDLLESRRQ